MENLRFLPCDIGTRAAHSDLPEETEDKYYIRILATNAKLDRHNSIMDPETTLKNFEKDAKSELGVALKDHHGTYSRSFGYGRSVGAKLTDKNELFIDFFILKNMDYQKESSFHFTSSEQLIRAIENGLVNQASVGFYDAREICNISKKPIRRYSYWDYEPDTNTEKSPYKMGKYYDIDGKQVQATYTVFNARLKEVSFVEFGSNRNTSIEKKRFGDEGFCDEVAGALRWIFTQKQEGHPFSGEMRSFMEELLMTDQELIQKLADALGLEDIRTDEDPEAFIQKIENEVSGIRQTVDDQKTEIENLRELSEGGDDPDGTLKKVLTEVSGLRKQIDDQKTEIASLRSDTKGGKEYRQARIEEAIKQGIRADGDDFDEEFHREYYADLPLEKIEVHIAKHKKRADAALPAGRRSSDTHEPPPERNKRRRGRANRR